MTLGDVIKEFRTAHGLTMGDFAKASGISKAYVSILEKNQRPKSGGSISPTIETYKKAAAGMGISLDQLFSMVDPDSSVSLVEDKDIEVSDKHLLLKLYDSMSRKEQEQFMEFLQPFSALDLNDRCKLQERAETFLESPKYSKNKKSKNA